MISESPIEWDETILPFQLDASNVRGRAVRLDKCLNQILGQHDYPAPIEALVAEAVLLTALIGQSIKLRWKLSLQIRGDGPARLIATDYFAPQAEGGAAKIRAWASYDADRISEGAMPFDLIGKGYFAVLIDQGEGTTPYSGLTPISGQSLSDCAATYFDQSEQLPTRFALTFGRSTQPNQDETWRAGGIMLQHLAQASSAMTGLKSDQVNAGSEEDENENWVRANLLLDSVEDLELIGPHVSPAKLLFRLFHEEEPRVFEPQKVHFGCTCSPERVKNALSIYSDKDIATMTTDEGVVTADCQFCGAHYRLDPEELGFQAAERKNGG